MRTELDKILTKIECGLASGDRDFYVMVRDRLTKYIKLHKNSLHGKKINMRVN